MKTKQLIDMEQIGRYFRDDCHPDNFLYALHTVIVNYIRCAGRSGDAVDFRTVCDDVEFLSYFYDCVKESMDGGDASPSPTLESEE